MIKLSRMALAILSAGLLVSPMVQAQTSVPAGPVADTLWTLAGSPYLVQGTVTIPDNSALTIQPGVEVIFQGNYQFIVEGKLQAVGTEADSILFTASNSLVGWGGLRFINAHVYSRLEYCRFELGLAEGTWPNGCGGAVYIEGAIQAIKHCSFVNNWSQYEGGAVYLWGGAPQFAYNLFTQNLSQNGNGHAICMGNCAGTVLDQLTLAENGSGTGYSLYVFAGTNLVMTNSILWDSLFSFDYIPGDVQYCDINTDAVSTDNFLQILGTGNLDVDPYFLDLEGGDLRVEQYSQTIDAASPSAPWENELQPNGGRANMGAYGNGTKATFSLPLFSFSRYVLNLDPPAMDFGLQKINTTGLDTLSIYNVGRVPLVLDSLLFSNDQFSSNFENLIDPATGFVTIAPDTSVLCTLLFIPVAVDSVEATMEIFDSDTTSAPTLNLSGVGVNPVIKLLPDTLDFGGATVGDSLFLPLGITNIGVNVGNIASDLLLAIEATSDNFVILDTTVVPPGDPTKIYDVIPVGDTLWYAVVFTPMGRLDFAENLPIPSNAGSASLHVTGTGSQAILDFDLEQDSLFFSVVAVGQDSTQEITLGNSGSIDLVLSDFELSDTINYSYVFDTTQSHIPPGDSLSIPITFHPDTAGTYNETLQIGTNVPTGLSAQGQWQYQTVMIHLFGTGTSQINWVIGAVTGTWEADKSPYYVVGNISVPAQAQLTIESGVQVLFEGDFGFTVSGTLGAIGDAENAIEFTTISADSHWVGMTFLPGSSGSLLRNCELYRGSDSLGGVLRIGNAAPTFELCNFHDNTATSGGAVALLANSAATFSDCRLYDNSATSGGALFADWFAVPQLSACELDGNSATNGGAIYLSGSLGEIHDCNIHNNSATAKGGGIYIGNGAAGELYGNEIHDNTANAGGGAALVWYVQPFVHDEAVYGNSATTSGGGIYIQDGCTPVILRTLIVQNAAPEGQAIATRASGAIFNYCTLTGAGALTSGWLLSAKNGDAAMISNSILWENSGAPVQAAASILMEGSEITVAYSDVYGDSTYPGLNNLNEDPQFVGAGPIWQSYALGDDSPLKDVAEDGGQIGAFGGSSALPWDITMAAMQHPVMTYLVHFVLTSTVPLLSLPYAYLEADLPDTVGYTPTDSSFMVQISPMIYRYSFFQSQAGYPGRLTFTLTNIFGADTALVLEFTSSPLSASGTSITFGPEISATARSLNGEGFWGIMPETYAEAKPVDPELLAIGQAYQVFASVDELADGQIEFALNGDLLNGRLPSGCAVAFWNDEEWQVLPSRLSGDGAKIRADMEQQGTYRLVWGETINTVMLPNEIELLQNYPNPFNPETAISFALPQAGLVKLEVFDLMGRRIATVLDGQQDAGFHRAVWKGTNSYGVAVASGIYFYRLQAGSRQITKKMILMR